MVVYERKLGANHQVYVKMSLDSGATWTEETRISTYAGMQNYDQRFASISIDSSDYLHVIWRGKSTAYPTNDQIWYAEYTTSWSAPIRISTLAGMIDHVQGSSTLTVASNDDLHTTWWGKDTAFPINNQIWYSKYTTSWSAPIRISTDYDMDDYAQSSSAITVDSSDYLHVAWAGRATGFPTSTQIWYKNFTVGWGDTTRLSTYAGMEDYSQTGLSIAVNSSDGIHVFWNGNATDSAVERQIWYAEYNTSWSVPIRISTYDGMGAYLQDFPSVAVDSSDYLHLFWEGKATGLADEDKTWYANNFNNSWTLYCIQQIGRSSFPNVRWSRWPVIDYIDDQYFITDENGTIVQDDLDSLDDAIDWIDTYDPDPLDPDPPGWPTEGPFIRFKMRLYFLAIGFGCLFGPILFFAWRRPSGYYILCGAILMLMGIGMLISIGQV